MKRTNLSLIVLLGTWLSCMKLKLETKGFVKDIEIDGGAVMSSLIVTYSDGISYGCMWGS